MTEYVQSLFMGGPWNGNVKPVSNVARTIFTPEGRYDFSHVSEGHRDSNIRTRVFEWTQTLAPGPEAPGAESASRDPSYSVERWKKDRAEWKRRVKERRRKLRESKRG